MSNRPPMQHFILPRILECPKYEQHMTIGDSRPDKDVESYRVLGLLGGSWGLSK